MMSSRIPTAGTTQRVPPLPPLTALRGQQMLAKAAKELSMESRDGIRTDGSRRSCATTARGERTGLSLDLTAHRRPNTARGHRSSLPPAHDIMASGPQALTVASARGRRKGVHTDAPLVTLGSEEKMDHQLQSICEQIGLKAAEKFSTVRQAFRYLDADHDGKISRSEMQYFFRAYNFSSETADRLFDRLDRDASGEVEYSEFMKYVAPYVQPDHAVSCHSSPGGSSRASTRTPSPLGCTSQPSPDPAASLDVDLREMLDFIGEKAKQKFSHAREVFRCVDCNDDGRISQGELRYFCRVFNLPEAKADKLFHHLVGATPGSTDINYHDFVCFLGPHLELPGAAAAMTQGTLSNHSSRRPSLQELGWDHPPQKTSRIGSTRGHSLSKPPSLVDAHDITGCYEANKTVELSPNEIEKEMKEVMKDIGEKLPLKFKHVRDAFRPLDVSHNGKITLTEMRSFLRGFGWPHEVADRFFMALDDEACGEIDFNSFMSHFEFVLGPANRPAPRHELITVPDDKLRQEINQMASILGEKLLTKFGSAREALRTLDLSNDGKITLFDMRLFFRTMCMPADAANKMFKCLCKNGADVVDYDDFLALFGPVDRPGGRWRTVQDLKGSARPSIWTIM